MQGVEPKLGKKLIHWANKKILKQISKKYFKEKATYEEGFKKDHPEIEIEWTIVLSQIDEFMKNLGEGKIPIGRRLVLGSPTTH